MKNLWIMQNVCVIFQPTMTTFAITVMKYVTTGEPKPWHWLGSGRPRESLSQHSIALSSSEGSKRSSNVSDYMLDNKQNPYSPPPTINTQRPHCNVKPVEFKASMEQWSTPSIHMQLALDRSLAEARALISLLDWRVRFPCLSSIIRSGSEPTILHFDSSISVFTLPCLDNFCPWDTNWGWLHRQHGWVSVGVHH